MNMRTHRLVFFAKSAFFTATLSIAAFLPSLSSAQDIMKIIVPFTAGGASDLFARAVADKLSARNKKTVIVEARPGAGGLISAQAVKNAAPDGNTILLTNTGLAIQSAKPNPAVDLRKDFLPIILTHTGMHTLYVNASVPVKNLQELIAYDKANPNKLNYASFGVGSNPHMAMELLKLKTGMSVNHVPYRSNAETLMSVVKGETQMSLNPYSSLVPYMKEGKIRAIALTSAKNSPRAPGVPGMEESGLPGYNALFWFGFHAPRGTSEEIVQQLNSDINAALQAPEVRKIIIEQFGGDIVGGSKDVFRKFLENDIEAYAGTIEQTGMKLDD